MSGIKLIYFDARGRAETSRLVLAAANQTWDDVRITKEMWPAERSKTPMGQLPYLVYKDRKYGQSSAIATFLAREFGLYGKTNQDGLRIDEIVQSVGDLGSSLAKARFETDEAKKAEAAKKLKDEEIPKYLGFFEKLLQDNGSSGYFVGKSLTLADLSVFNITDSVEKFKCDATAAYPLILKLRRNVAQHPNLKKYLATRKETAF